MKVASSFEKEKEVECTGEKIVVANILPDQCPYQLLKDFTGIHKEGSFIAFMFLEKDSNESFVGFGRVRSSVANKQQEWILETGMTPHDPDALLSTYYEEEQWCVPVLMELIVAVGLQFAERSKFAAHLFVFY